MAAARADDLAGLIYTSGTTSAPKGAMLSVANVDFAIESLVERAGFLSPPPNERDVVLSYLPLCHVAERLFTTWFNAGAGVQVNFAESIATVEPNLREIQPTILFGVPRIWEKILAGVRIRLASASPVKRGLGQFWLRRADRIGDTLVRTGGRHTIGTRLVVGHRLRGLLPRAARPPGHAQGALRGVGRGPHRTRGAQVLHGHRGADARGLRHDRADRGRARPTGRVASGWAPSASRTGAWSCASTTDRGDPDPASGHRHGLLAGRGGRPARRSTSTAGCTPATSASGSTARTSASPTG